eukprot:CAMPEP_0185774162 /NCGR_PEP_ID=MMETSP1174-20130828/76948_1 /TAXON_ID=35687 /ORGANISM="Dictyocha speculum, Strain CCMP1381" /LENGTH=134 /DNA_ID=CAMNT_0028461187 /DNA_START=894 /DNA_END=1296 /DNA_ORIENTATION=+
MGIKAAWVVPVAILRSPSPRPSTSAAEDDSTKPVMKYNHGGEREGDVKNGDAISPALSRKAVRAFCMQRNGNEATAEDLFPPASSISIEMRVDGSGFGGIKGSEELEFGGCAEEDQPETIDSRLRGRSIFLNSS